MESILARALEYTLKYWLKSFTRDQFKLQGRKVQLSNLDIDGDALHSSMGLPPALHVATAKVGMLEIMLPSISNVQVEPIVVQIDRLDLVLEEQSEPHSSSTASSSASSSSGRGGGYGFADKIADGMTVEVGTVNLLLETRGGAGHHGGATWTPPMASITIRGLVLCTTNENWKVVSLKEARDFSSNKKFIYLFKKLEWESLSVDLLPHPDMFLDPRLLEEGVNKRDDDGAKRVFFGGERLLEGISGQAYITVQRTELNDPLGLEVRLHIGEAVCPALSEPGLRALLRFLTGLYVCLNRGDVDLKSQQRSTEAAGCSLVSILVDHIFFCIKDTEFQLELLVQSLHFSRASISHGENSRDLTEMTIGGLFLRDTVSNPPCTLIQPSMADVSGNIKPVPDFAKDCCPAIYPLGEQQFESYKGGVPLICIYSLQPKPTPSPPHFATQTAVYCQPLLLHLQEESCFRISSFLADGIVAGRGTLLQDFSITSLEVTLEELDIIVPLKTEKLDSSSAEARLHMENIFFSESPSLKMLLLDLEKDPACFSFWEGQPIDASQKKWTSRASFLTLSLDTSSNTDGHKNSVDCTSGLWRCIELKDACIEVAMATPDGSPLISAPPAGGVVRIGVDCKQLLSNTSVEQLFFVLNLYTYIGDLGEKIAAERKSNEPSIQRTESWGQELMSRVPSDTAVRLSLNSLQLRFLEDCSNTILVQFVGKFFSVKVAHRTLGGAVAITSAIRWEAVEINCVDAEQSLTYTIASRAKLAPQNDSDLTTSGQPELRAVLWVNKDGDLPFLDVNMTHVVPFDARDSECHSFTLSACIAGIRLGGGMSYTEQLLHRFGILGPDGGPGEGLSRGLQNLSAGPLSKMFKPSPLVSQGMTENGTHENGDNNILSYLGQPDDVDVCIDLKDWLFALEGAKDILDSLFGNHESISREDRCWHSTFRSFHIKAKNNSKGPLSNSIVKSRAIRRYPVDVITVGVEDLQALKPQAQVLDILAGNSVNGIEQNTAQTSRGVNFEASMGISEGDFDFLTGKWELKRLKFSVDEPIEAVITRDEVQHLATLCKTEVDSMGRITVGILRILKLEETVGMEALGQLSNLGSGGFDKLFTADKFPKAGKVDNLRLKPEMHTIVMSLEEEANNSQAKCANLIAEMGTAGPSSAQHLQKIKELESRLQGMQRLLNQLRTDS